MALKKMMNRIAAGILLTSLVSFSQTSWAAQFPNKLLGTWSVSQKLVKGDAPKRVYQAPSNEVWLIYQEAGSAVIENGITHEKFPLKIVSIEGETVKATTTLNTDESESTLYLTLSAKDNELLGTNHQEMVVYKKRQEPQTYNVYVEITGKRLATKIFQYGRRH